MPECYDLWQNIVKVLTENKKAIITNKKVIYSKPSFGGTNWKNRMNRFKGGCEI